MYIIWRVNYFKMVYDLGAMLCLKGVPNIIVNDLGERWILIMCTFSMMKFTKITCQISHVFLTHVEVVINQFNGPNITFMSKTFHSYIQILNTCHLLWLVMHS
jgi:hypothetical protein